MGVDMETLGGALRLVESPRVSVKRALEALDAAGYPSADVYRVADYSWAKTPEQLFISFKQFMFADASGVYRLAGYDDRFYDPTPLFGALGSALADGSWIAYRNDLDDDVFHFVGVHSGVVETTEISFERSRSASVFWSNQSALVSLLPDWTEWLVSDAQLPQWYTSQDFSLRYAELDRLY